MSEVKRYEFHGENERVMQFGMEYVASDDYDALAAELAEARSERQREHDLRVKIGGEAEALASKLAAAHDTLDYFGHSPPYDGSQARAHTARIAELQSANNHCHEAMEKLATRVVDLEAALIKYFAHQMTCDLKRPCSCGWDATADSLGLKALAPQEPP